MDWQALKQQAGVWFTRAAQFWMMQTVLVYLWACIVARKPIGPKDYVRFSYHVIQWQPGGTSLAAAYPSHKSEEHKPEDISEQDKPHMNFLENR
jgi:hypothetical protein